MPEKRPTTILHVDDREENRYIVSKILRHAGFHVIEGTTGRQALELAASQPDLIILDIRLPDILGYEVSRRIKANPATNAIPIIQLSASFVTDESKVQALDSGADQFLTQPVEAPVLVASVNALLRMRRAEAISRLSARQWQTTFDALSEGIGLLDNEQNILRCNRSMSELLALPYSELEGHNCKIILHSVFGLAPDSLQKCLTRQVFESQAATRCYRITVDPVANDNNEPIGSILVIADTTAQKQAEEALKITASLAATGRLAHSIAHEINNPLGAVTNLIFLLKEAMKDQPTAMGFLNTADSELRRVSQITKQTLSFHRDSAQPVRVSLVEIINSVLVLYGQQLRDKGMTVEKRFDGEGIVDAFPGQLRQVFSNFIGNGLDASLPQGRFIIHVYDSRSWREDNVQGVRVVFCDTGQGISAQDMNHIFEAFFTTKGQKGSGLGLWLSMGIINAHDGRIRVRSRTHPPSGTCFSLFFPRSIVAKGELSLVTSPAPTPSIAAKSLQKETA